MTIGMKVQHIYNDIMTGRVIGFGPGPDPEKNRRGIFEGKIQVEWSDGRSFMHSGRFLTIYGGE